MKYPVITRVTGPGIFDTITEPRKIQIFIANE